MTSVYNYYDLTIQFADRFYVNDPLYIRKPVYLMSQYLSSIIKYMYLVTTYLSVYFYIVSPVRRCALLNHGFPSTIKPTLPYLLFLPMEEGGGRNYMVGGVRIEFRCHIIMC